MRARRKLTKARGEMLPKKFNEYKTHSSESRLLQLCRTRTPIWLNYALWWAAPSDFIFLHAFLAKKVSFQTKNTILVAQSNNNSNLKASLSIAP